MKDFFTVIGLLSFLVAGTVLLIVLVEYAVMKAKGEIPNA